MRKLTFKLEASQPSIRAAEPGGGGRNEPARQAGIRVRVRSPERSLVCLLAADITVQPNISCPRRVVALGANSIASWLPSPVCGACHSPETATLSLSLSLSRSHTHARLLIRTHARRAAASTGFSHCSVRVRAGASLSESQNCYPIAFGCHWRLQSGGGGGGCCDTLRFAGLQCAAWRR